MRSTTVPEDSATIRARVLRTRQKQIERFSTSREKLYCNAQMHSRHIRAHCELSTDCERLLATGRYDALAGRYLHAEHDDVDELLARIDEVRERDLNAIRLQR